MPPEISVDKIQVSHILEPISSLMDIKVLKIRIDISRNQQVSEV